MLEMRAWEALKPEHKEAMADEAKQLLLGTKEHVADLKSPEEAEYTDDEMAVWMTHGEPSRELRRFHANPEYVKVLDRDILSALYRLKRYVRRPLVPLYVAVWQMAMSIPLEELEGNLEQAVAMLMRRVQDSADYVHRFNKNRKDEFLRNQLAVRGFFN